MLASGLHLIQQHRLSEASDSQFDKSGEKSDNCVKVVIYVSENYISSDKIPNIPKNVK